MRANPKFLTAALGCALVGLAGLAPAARAEIYGWVDGNGHFTYSNLPPPDSARVTDVIPEETSRPVPGASNSARLADLAALNDRIRLLELEQARERREAQQLAAAYAPPDYYPPPLSAPAGGCGPDGTYSCSDWGPAYPVGVPYIAYGPRWTPWRHGSVPWRGGPAYSIGAVTTRSNVGNGAVVRASASARTSTSAHASAARR